MRWLWGMAIGSLLLWPCVGHTAGGEVAKATMVSSKAQTKSGTVLNQHISTEEIRLAITHHLEKQFAGKMAEISVALLFPDDAVTIPQGKAELKVKGVYGEERLGRQAFQVSFILNGKEIQTVRAMVQVDAQADLITASRYIKPDETISAEDLSITRMQIPPSMMDFILNRDEVIGKRSTRPIQADKPIRVSILAEPYAVRKGDRVTIEAKRGGLVIHAVGVTKGSAQMGQQVTVTNQDSGKDLRGKVIGPGTVQVEF